MPAVDPQGCNARLNFMKGKHCLALDFDGVIADSILECLLTAENAYSAYHEIDDFHIDLSRFSKTEVADFRASRIFIRRGEDYVFLRLAADQNHLIGSQEAFDAFLEIHSSKRDTFRDLFYSMRERLQTTNPAAWLALSPIYPEIELFLKQLKDPDALYIVTTKDLISVQLILASKGIHLPPEHMFQATKTYRKPEILKNILKLENLTPPELHFIDDHPATVLEVAENTEVTAYCAAWGYNTSTQLAALKTRSLQILNPKDFQEFARALGLVN